MEFLLTPEEATVSHDGEIIATAHPTQVAHVFFSGGGQDLGLLPAAVRWISRDGLAVIMERPPSVVNISYKEEQYSVPVPWQVWGVRVNPDGRIEKAFLFARPYPMVSLEDELFSFPLPNMSNNGEVTPPSRMEISGRAFGEIILAYWARPFTGAFNEILEDKSQIPDEWIPHINEGVEKYLISLGDYDTESITFAPLKLAPMMNIGALIMQLDPQIRENEKPDFFKDVLKLVQTASSEG